MALFLSGVSEHFGGGDAHMLGADGLAFFSGGGDCATSLIMIVFMPKFG